MIDSPIPPPTRHLTFEQLGDLAERGENPPAHVLECDVCQATLSEVRELMAATRALPRELTPPAEVWSDIRARILTEQPVVARQGGARWWHSGWLASAAAIVLIVGTMTLTARFTSTGRPAKAKALMTANVASPALYAVDKNYAGTIQELRMALEAQRARLSPATIRTVERSLQLIDEAIAEARAALAADPANQLLADILASHYERQVDLLRRATQLSYSL